MVRDWEALLKAEGLGHLDGVCGATSGRHEFPVETSHVAMSDAVTMWQNWALGVLDTHAFTNERQREIWTHYASGKSYGQIQALVGGSRRAISWAVAAVESTAPVKPCGNPWRQDHKGHAAAKDPRIAWYEARRRRRAEQRQEKTMAQSPVTRFSRILFVPGQELEVIGRPVRNSMLMNVTGRHVNGGIEVYGQIDKATDEVHPFPYAMWLPGNRIKQADRLQDLS